MENKKLHLDSMNEERYRIRSEYLNSQDKIKLEDSSNLIILEKSRVVLIQMKGEVIYEDTEFYSTGDLKESIDAVRLDSPELFMKLRKSIRRYYNLNE